MPDGRRNFQGFCLFCVMAKISTVEELEAELRDDLKVKVAGIDVDGIMRGKVLAKDKFMSAARVGLGFCRCLFLTISTDSEYNFWMGHPRQGENAISTSHMI